VQYEREFFLEITDDWREYQLGGDTQITVASLRFATCIPTTESYELVSYGTSSRDAFSLSFCLQNRKFYSPLKIKPYPARANVEGNRSQHPRGNLPPPFRRGTNIQPTPPSRDLPRACIKPTQLMVNIVGRGSCR
jgi:hypothetical protein